ncbi:MAG TPA: 50S ribosomal protein L17 [Candidatus Saccharimonadales bacterium]|nr:50S ribosomal protein L17 [Candidatus Saccharimonadales bacterium]
MHRHGYQAKKLSLERDQRRALIRGQVTALVLHESITTTEAKAKTVAPYFERLVAKARKNDLHNGRQLRSFLLTENAVQKLIQELVPAFDGRQGGYTRVIKAGARRGDNAPMAVVSLVLPDQLQGQSAKSTESSGQTKKPAETSPDSKAAAGQTATKTTMANNKSETAEETS